MKSYQREFIEFSLANNALKFGEFTLKSGRISPYFFNAGNFKDGSALNKLGEFYAATLIDHFKDNEYDVLFGPAYKGIQLVTITSIGLDKRGNNVPVCFNRKEAKGHGERGTLIGADITNKKVLLIDDVITAGTTVHHAAQIIQQNSASLAGIVIALDRQEKGLGSELSGVQEIENKYNTKVVSIVTLDNLIEYLKDDISEQKHLDNIINYRQQYGIMSAQAI